MKKIMLTLCSLTAASAFASDFNMGYINVDRVMAEATPAKAISTAIKAKFAPQQQKLMADESQLVAFQKKASDFNKLSKADQTKYKTMVQTFQQQYGAYQQQVNATEQYAIQTFLKQAYVDLQNLGTKNNLDAIYTSNQLIYAKAKYDVTDQFIKQIDQMDVTPIIKQINNGPNVQDAATQAPAMNNN